MTTEADARIIVDRLLREADWDIEDKSQVSTEEAAADGRADYLLKNQRTQPIAVIEAKRFSIDPYSAKGQAKDYAVSLGAPRRPSPIHAWMPLARWIHCCSRFPESLLTLHYDFYQSLNWSCVLARHLPDN
jgi:hypothetical protein